MVALHLHTDFFHQLHHFSTNIIQAVTGRNRKISFFITRLVTQIGAFIAARVPVTFTRVNIISRMIDIGLIANVIEHEKFRFWTEISCIADSR